MILAVIGNIVTSWSWFGVNMLGIGLHSYGFIDSQLIIILRLEILSLAVALLRGTSRNKP
jgi:hypothetical protein